MDFLEWHESFSLGVKNIDRRHRKLFSLCNELIAHTRAGQQKKILGKVLNGLMDYAADCFKMEERLLKFHPELKKHRDTHQLFITRLSGFAASFKSGSTNIKPALAGFLIDWIKNHVLDMDKTYFQGPHPFIKSAVEGESKNDIASPLIREKVLVVDNLQDQRICLRAMLEKESYTVLEANNAADALQICQDNWDIRIVITDIRIPGKGGGYQFIKTLRRQQLRPIYIIVVTFLADKESVIKAFSSGADDFLSKPVFPGELHQRIFNGLKLLRLESQNVFIYSMAKMSDYRSLETGGHLKRVSEYTLEIGKYLARHYPEKGVTNEMADAISVVSPLHDIGKVAISDWILKKPGPLTDEEFEIMKEHPMIGGDLISDIYLKTGAPRFRIAVGLTRYHHEKWDGTGYPAGLSGNDIPIAARIMALADVYDALTTDRVYKRAFSHEKAKQIIIKGKAGHFDPDLVDVFLALEKKFMQLKEEFSDENLGEKVPAVREGQLPVTGAVPAAAPEDDTVSGRVVIHDQEIMAFTRNRQPAGGNGTMEINPDIS